MKRLGKYLLLAVLLALPLMVAQRSVAQTTPEVAAVEEVAEREDVPASRLAVAEMDATSLPLTGRELHRAKLVDERTGRVYGVTLDQAGEAVDFEQAKQAERAAYEEQYGALHPVLYQQLQSMAEGETLTVAIWLEMDGLEALSRPEPEHEMATAEAGDAAPPVREVDADGGEGDGPQEEKDEQASPERPTAPDSDRAEEAAAIEAAEAENAQWLAERVSAVQEPLLDELAERGYEATTASDTAPLVYVELPRAEILEMAERADVDTIYAPNENADLMDVAKPTQKADVAENWGFEGDGVSVAILEDSRVEFDNPYLDLGGSSESDTVRVPGDSNVDQHATATAGMVASQHGTQEGIAQGADLYSANATTYNDSDLSDAMDWAVNNHLDIINNSWGGNTGNTDLNVHDRHLDYIVRNEADTVTVAAGNEANGCQSGTDRVVSPARAYNVISVGGFNDNNTTTWDDDTVYICSSFVDPSTGVEKPEVAASGANIVSTSDDSSNWIEGAGSGTSYAAPMVSGEAAILLNQDTALRAYPETVKAIIMATALHNIEGDTRLSDVDGAGAVDMRAASHLVDEGWWGWRNLQASDFPYTYTQYAHAGETVRAVIAWNSNPASDYSTDPLDADLDLRVYDEDGNFVSSSVSFNNSYEIVEFEVPDTGYYDFVLSDFRFDGTNEFVGFAFWPGMRALEPYNSAVYDTPPTSHDYYRIEAAGEWTVAGIRTPSGHDYDIFLYDGSAFADPDDHVWLEDSTLGGDDLDFVVVDGNHAPQEDYFAEAEAYSGSGGTYEIEWGDSLTTAVDGSYGPYTMAPTDVVRVWDVPVSGGEEKRILVRPLNGNVDVGAALFDTDSGDSTSWYQGRSQAVAEVDDNGLDQDEMLTYTPGDSDEVGLVVWSNAATTSSDFNLYVDSTPPTGTIQIDGALAYANSTSVSIGMNVGDGETSVTEMRFSNDGSSWSAWEPFSGTKSWTLPSGDGLKTVYAEFRNTVSMTTVITDSIYLDTAPPTTSASSPSSTTSTSFSVSWSGSDALAGVDSYDVQYRVGTSGSWTDWLTGTTDTSAVFGPDNPLTVERDQTYQFRVRARDFAGNVSTYGSSDTETDVELLDLFTPFVVSP